ncbi:MAG: hypothetical protein J3K34DRAFT_457915, partial [Monoraphidium minutum]
MLGPRGAAHMRPKSAAARWAAVLVVLTWLSCSIDAQVLEADGYELAPPLLAASGGALAQGRSQPLDDPRAVVASSLPPGAEGDALTDADLASAIGLVEVAALGGDADAGAPGLPAPTPFAAMAAGGGPDSDAAAAAAPVGELVRAVRKAGDVIPGRYILHFADNATSADAIAGVQKRVLSIAASAARKAKRGSAAAGRMSAASVGGTEFGVFEVEHVLGESEGAVAASEVGAPGVMRVSAAARRGGRPPKGAVLVVSGKLESRQVRRAMAAAPGVSSVIEDRVIAVAQARPSAAAGCVPPSYLAGTVATPTAMEWDGCYVPGVTKIAWFGERCGSYMTGANWLGMYAFYTANSTLVSGCVRYRSRKVGDPYNTANFGACGAPPAAAPQLPSQLCSDAAPGRRGSGAAPACLPADGVFEWGAALDAPVKCGGVSTSGATYRGMRCGPGMRYVRWSSVTLPDGGRSCRFSRNSSDLRWNAQWLGQCGVPPQFNMALPARVCAADDAPAPPGTGAAPRPSPSPL